MARRVLKPLTPVLVTLVAVVIGFLTIGPSFAGTGAPSDGPVPAPPVSVATSATVPTQSAQPAATPTQSVLPAETVPTASPTRKPKVTPQPAASGAHCSSCLAPPGE